MLREAVTTVEAGRDAEEPLDVGELGALVAEAGREDRRRRLRRERARGRCRSRVKSTVAPSTTPMVPSGALGVGAVPVHGALGEAAGDGLARLRLPLDDRGLHRHRLRVRRRGEHEEPLAVRVRPARAGSAARRSPGRR